MDKTPLSNGNYTYCDAIGFELRVDAERCGVKEGPGHSDDMGASLSMNHHHWLTVIGRFSAPDGATGACSYRSGTSNGESDLAL